MAIKKPSTNPAAVALGRVGGLKGGPARTPAVAGAADSGCDVQP